LIRRDPSNLLQQWFRKVFSGNLEIGEKKYEKRDQGVFT